MSDARSANRSLAIGATTNWAAFAAALAVGFFLAPYLVRGLGDARYGVWCVVESILAYFTLFDLGIAACLVRFVAKHHATGDRADLNRVVSASLGLFLLAACGVLVLGERDHAVRRARAGAEARHARRRAAVHAAHARQPRGVAPAQRVSHRA